MLELVLLVDVIFAVQPTPVLTSFHDGERVMTVRRVAREASGRTRVVLEGFDAVAEVGATAIVELETGVNAPSFFLEREVRLIRQLLPSRSLWLVRDARDARDGLELAAALDGLPGVRYAEPDLYFRRALHSMPVPPNDPRYPGQWYLSRVNIERAWLRQTGSSDVTIEVVDNGCEATHPDLVAHMLPGRDVVDSDDDPSPDEPGKGANHGTACAGIIAGVGNNAIGIAGACPECKLRCVRLLGGQGGMVPISADVDAMRFAIDHSDVAVVSNSWGFVDVFPVPEPFKQAIHDASTQGRGGKGALLVFAAGNENRVLQPYELYSLPEVLTVGAINNFDEVAPFSNHGVALDVVAPTGSLTTDLTGDAGESTGDYTSLFGGTSSACPVVSGVAGLLFSARPDVTAEEMQAVIVETARPAPYATPDSFGHDLIYGYGVVNPGGALESLLGIVPDAGVDAGSVADAGGGVVDGGTMEPDPMKQGCGCTSVPTMALVVLTGLVARRRAVRRRTLPSCTGRNG